MSTEAVESLGTGLQDRIAGVLAGQAAGDALGAGYEFAPPTIDAKDLDMIGGGLGNWEQGEWTDDTQQAIIVARAHSEALAVSKGLIDWYEGGPKDVGTTTSASLSAGLQSRRDGDSTAEQFGKLLDQSYKVQGDSNGSLMRTSPVALSFIGQPWAAAARAGQISALTHAGAQAREASMIWTVLIERAVREGTPLTREHVTSAISTAVAPSRRQFWEDIANLAFTTTPKAYRSLNLWNGKAVTAFEEALSAVVHAKSTEDGLRKAVAIGGDTDTVAAIAGGLLGALNGASSIPEAWRKQLHGWPGMDYQGLVSLALAASGDTGKEQS